MISSYNITHLLIMRISKDSKRRLASRPYPRWISSKRPVIPFISNYLFVFPDLDLDVCSCYLKSHIPVGVQTCFVSRYDWICGVEVHGGLICSHPKKVLIVKTDHYFSKQASITCECYATCGFLNSMERKYILSKIWQPVLDVDLQVGLCVGESRCLDSPVLPSFARV